QAAVCWSSALAPQIKTDVNVGTFFGRGSGESVQLAFHGPGFVVVQPAENADYSTACVRDTRAARELLVTTVERRGHCACTVASALHRRLDLQSAQGAQGSTATVCSGRPRSTR